MLYHYITLDSTQFSQEDGYVTSGLFDHLKGWTNMSLACRPNIVIYNGGWEYWIQRDVIGYIDQANCIAAKENNGDYFLSVDTEFRIEQDSLLGNDSNGQDNDRSGDYMPLAKKRKIEKAAIEEKKYIEIDWVFNRDSDEELIDSLPTVLLVELKAYRPTTNINEREQQIDNYLSDIEKLLNNNYKGIHFNNRDIKGVAIFFIAEFSDNQNDVNRIISSVKQKIKIYRNDYNERVALYSICWEINDKSELIKEEVANTLIPCKLHCIYATVDLK